LIIMVIGPLTTMPVLRLLNTPDSIIDWCTGYLVILFLGFAGTGYYNILGGVLRGLGDSVSALVYLIVATVINIVLDYVFVAWFGLGVPGVALATIIAQIISAILTLRKLMHMRDIFDLKKEYIKPEWVFSKELVRLGLPSGLTQAIISLSMVVVQSLTNSFGETFIAANIIVMRVDGFVMLPAFSFGTAMTTFAGQNIGAGRMDRVVTGTRNATLAAMGISTALSLLILVFGKGLMGIFTKTPELITISYNVMRILLIGYIAMEMIQCLSGVMRGAGDTMTPMWISIFNSVIIRMPLAYLLVFLSKTPERPQGNFYMMGLSLLITWLVSAVITLFLYRRGKWRTKAVNLKM
ncbi:MAG: MATE family efflux transporter, partial [Lachnospiraceae bacterium]|nr:MATE family efflux transporter [Lachnospiraceae bacterium]